MPYNITPDPEPDNRPDHVDWSGDKSGCLLVAIPAVLLLAVILWIVLV